MPLLETLPEALEHAIEIEYLGKRLIVVDRNLDTSAEEIDQYVSVIGRYGQDGLWIEWDISLLELKDDLHLKVYHPTRINFSHGE